MANEFQYIKRYNYREFTPKGRAVWYWMGVLVNLRVYAMCRKQAGLSTYRRFSTSPEIGRWMNNRMIAYNLLCGKGVRATNPSRKRTHKKRRAFLDIRDTAYLNRCRTATFS